MATRDLMKILQELRELNLLDELERNPICSQRELSRRFKMALGVTNSCLKEMVRKGWVRIRGLDHRKSGYFLTPDGEVEKTRLSQHLLSWRVEHYSALKTTIEKILNDMVSLGMKRVVFYGVGPAMEVAYITLQGADLKLVGIVEDDEKFDSKIIFGHEIEPVSRVRELKPDCVFITSLEGKDKRRERLNALLDKRPVLIRDIVF
jgi:DNA-binding MarR family transcriptional regulator